MALARVVAFDGVDSGRMAQLKQRLESEPRPDDLPATEIMILHDAEKSRSLAVVFFENEADYAAGDAALSAMDRGDTPGNRVSVDRYDVVVRATA